MKISIALVLASLVSTSVLAVPAQWPVSEGGNGHYYEWVPGTMTWESALAQAAELSWDGAAGHLATLTSPEENAWVWQTFNQPFQAWLGGYQPNPNSPASVGWVWITGEAWAFTNWQPGEPNDGGDSTQEDVLHFAQSGYWNNLDRVYSQPGGMIVEFEPAAVSTESGSWGSIRALYRR